MTRRELGIIGATFLGQAVAIGSTIGAFTLFVRPVAETFDASTLAVSSGVSLLTLMLAASGLAVGTWLDRGSPRTVMFTGCAILTTGLLVASQATALWQLALVCVFTGVGIPMLGPLTTAAVISKAFDETRGRALGLANMGINIGGFSFALLAALVIEAADWRTALQAFAALVVFVALPGIALGLPKDLDARGVEAGQPEADFEPRALLASSTFLMAALSLGAVMGTAAGWASHAAPFVKDLGGTTRAAGVLVAAAQGIAVLGTLGFGMLADRVRPAGLLIALVSVQIACLATLFAGAGLGVAAVAIVLFGLMSGGIMPLFAQLLVERFGTGSLGRAFGLANLFLLPFGFGLPMVGGAIRDAQGSYAAMLLLCALLLAGSIGLLAGLARGPALQAEEVVSSC